RPSKIGTKVPEILQVRLERKFLESYKYQITTKDTQLPTTSIKSTTKEATNIYITRRRSNPKAITRRRAIQDKQELSLQLL
ncbi:hypothetical protein LINPERHAP2_LOCUS12528, partial [Linum perenne]